MYLFLSNALHRRHPLVPLINLVDVLPVVRVFDWMELSGKDYK